MLNGIMRRAFAAVMAALTTALLLTATPAQAAGSCGGSAGAALKPAALSGGRFVLTNTRSRGYTGTPFSFQLVMHRGGFPDSVTSQTYSYNDRRHSMTTGALRSGTAVLVRTWCGGRRGADWVGRVGSR